MVTNVRLSTYQSANLYLYFLLMRTRRRLRLLTKEERALCQLVAHCLTQKKKKKNKSLDIPETKC